MRTTVQVVIVLRARLHERSLPCAAPSGGPLAIAAWGDYQSGRIGRSLWVWQAMTREYKSIYE